MPTNWEQAYQSNDTPWDKGSAAPPLQEFLQQQLIAGSVLVPGCGAGHDVRLLSAHGANVVGADLAPTALTRALSFSKVGDETYLELDFLNLPEAHQGRYDWVVEHTCLCAIDPSQRFAYVDSLQLALRPKGRYLAIFFRKVDDYTGDGPPHPISSQQIETLFAADFDCLQRFTPKQHYPGRPYGAEEVVLFERR